ncbi:MAG: hypothetical protein KBD17_02280 [Candidatus Pacebacteria bacterium]|nr:hypothetical protein [Candidatus Paceibacterota bacterium]
MKPICIDFEYNSSAEPRLNLVCAAFKFEGQMNSIWLENNPENKKILADWLLEHKEHPIIAFNAVAEGQSFIALGLNPRDFKWIDLQIEMKMLMNSDDEYEFGKHLSKGKVVEVMRSPPKYDFDTEEEYLAEEEKLRDQGFLFKAPRPSLVSTAFKLLGKRIDAEEKDKMRDLIIAKGPFSEEEKEKILLYCESDAEVTWDLFKWFNRKKFKDYNAKDILWRGRTAANCAVITACGYPVDLKKVKALRGNIPSVFKQAALDINSQFDFEVFHWNNVQQSYSMNQKLVRQEIERQNPEKLALWPRTATGLISLEIETVEKMFGGTRHHFDKGNMGHQFIRWKKLESSLKSIRGHKKDSDFLNYIGSDKRVRAWLNPYGSQTARYQPPSTQFLFLKSAWLRGLCHPAKGKVLLGVDYASQEYLLQAVLSEDKDMFESYLSGDVYLAFAKASGMVPKEATKETHKADRDAAKAAVLGIGYGMGSEKLSIKITDDSKKKTTPDEARELIEAFRDSYPEYDWYKRQIYSEYRCESELCLLDGWKMFGDNPSKNSIQNFPVQGLGSCIMRKAIDLCLDRGINVIFPLHDALYVECGIGEWQEVLVKLCEIMKEASGFYFKGEFKTWAESVRFDADVWGHGITPKLVWDEKKKKDKNTHIFVQGIPVKMHSFYIDDRSEEEYDKFSKYFEETELNF